MKKTSINLFLIFCSCGLWATHAYGQAAPQNLAQYVNDPANGASALQVSAGNAVQRACGALIAQGIQDGGQGGLSLTGAPGDLFLRCNELVETAFDLTGGTGPLDRSLGISDSELLAAVQQVSGEELLGQTSLTTRITSGQFSNIAARLNALRIGGANAALGGRVASTGPYNDPDRNSPGYGGLSLDSRFLTGGAAAGDADVAGSRIGWFLEGSFNTGDRDQTAREDGFDFDATSLTLGLDYLLDSGVIGASVGVDNYEADFENSLLVSGGSLEVEGTSGSLFAALYRGNLYFDGILSFGNLDTDTVRRAVYSSTNTCDPATPCPGENDTLTGETDGDFVAAGATVGYDANRGNWDISTTLSLAYRDIDIDGYNETDAMGGGLPLSFADQTIESLRSILGVAFTGNFSRNFGILSPQLRIEWHHEFEDDPVPLLAKYVVEEQLTVPGAAGAGVFSLDAAQCISCFQINSDKIDTDFALVGVGLSAVFSRRVQIYGVYDALIGLDNISSNAFSVGIRGQF